jgi:lincosamide nucleotidyltransferase A/C/D/E
MQDASNDDLMPAEHVTTLITLLEKSAIRVWVDGGWGVDALLGEQTRLHQDLDIVVDRRALSQVLGLLIASGFEVFQDEMPARVELRDDDGHRVDIHPLTFDSRGNGLQELQDGTFGMYTVDGLSGKGLINGVEVNCLSPELQMRFHEGYEPDENDVKDVYALHSRFGMKIPDRYCTRSQIVSRSGYYS